MARSFWRCVAVYFGFAENPPDARRDRELAALSRRRIAAEAAVSALALAVLLTFFWTASHGFHHIASAAVFGVPVGCGIALVRYFSTAAGRDQARARAAAMDRPRPRR